FIRQTPVITAQNSVMRYPYNVKGDLLKRRSPFLHVHYAALKRWGDYLNNVVHSSLAVTSLNAKVILLHAKKYFSEIVTKKLR
ncbi:MAG: hypothetical protein AAGA75_24495, partial [Cyanobacteria bacterium P01_E01_bin.6]